jgi:hypothetical protein
MACKPNCPYFPNPTNNVEFTIDEFGVKHCSRQFICGFNSGTITGWGIDCPRDLVNKNKEEENAKCKGKQGKLH